MRIGGRKLRGYAKKIRVFKVHQGVFEFGIKPFRTQVDFAIFRLQNDPGEVLGGLNVHVLIIIHLGQLRPEGNVDAHRDEEGSLHVFMREDPHPGGEQIPRKGHAHIRHCPMPFYQWGWLPMR